MSTAFVDVSRLNKTYSRGPIATPVLRDVSMTFERGSFSAIVGPSGCGKTTLLSVLGALDAGDSGSVVVDGLDLREASARELTEYRRRSIGFVFQFYNLLPSLTAVENVESGLEFFGLRAPARRARAMDWLARVGMADLAARFPAQLSGGQQQRVAVARVLAREPKLLLADEPTGNLDEESGERIIACMKSLQRESGVTCLVVTHDVELAARADAVVRLRDGRVVEDELARSGEVPIVRPRRQSGVDEALGVGLGGSHGLRAAGSWR
ncbi:MAG: ABC transporter ATP-binding protein [Labilithrix sp.]|nr:ABC transporter ATP-binding protein [Labilithrix sp.]